MTKESNKDKAINDAYALMQMYQAGFLDARNKKKYTEKLKKECLKCFEKRFGCVFKKSDDENKKTAV